MLNTSLLQTTICIEGAKSMYYTHASYYGLAVPDFDRLSPRAKQEWVERCQELVLAVGPARPTKQAEYDEGFASAKVVATTTSSSKVIATTTPQAPWGRNRA